MSEYFHVVVKMKTQPKVPLFLFGDLSKKELKTRFIRPYLAGRSIMIGNDLVALGDVSSVQIIKTAEKKDDCLQHLQMTSGEAIDRFNAHTRETGAVLVSIGTGWANEDIVEAGDDVTERYIRTPPGAGTVISDTLQNPWVVAIGTGIILLMIGAFVLA